MANKNNRYIEVKIDNNGKNNDNRNPLTRQYRYEYALYLLIANLFHSVRCRSMNVNSLRLYFMEVPDKSDKTKTKEDIIGELIPVINRDVLGHIRFPMMHVCAAEVTAKLEKDGSHTFVFSDGIYGFSVHLNKIRNGYPIRIKVTDISKSHEKSGKTKESKKAAVKCAA